MGKAIIVPNVDWSLLNLGTITPATLVIAGNDSFEDSGVYSAYYNGNPANASWSISDTAVATLSNNTGTSVTLTAVASGAVRLTATFNGKTVYMDISVVLTPSVITQNDLTVDMVRYFALGNGNTRVAIPLTIVDASSFYGSLRTNRGVDIKTAIQFWDAGQGAPGSDSSNPPQGVINTSHTTWDSGWKLAGQSAVNFSYANNKDNTIVTATSTETPAVIALVATYNTNNTGMPPLSEIVSGIQFEFHPKG